MDELIKIGAGTEYPLEGILSLPEGVTEPVPGVVLVHGSGPSDRDETVGANRPFRDIAEGLSARGIAVLRYDKRTKIHGRALMKEPPERQSVREECIEDAILASRLLKNDKRINPDKVYIFGHSLGGMLAPRIDAGGGDFAGLIIAAGSPRTLSDIMISQNERLLGELNPLLKKIAGKQIAKLKESFASLETMSEAEAQQKKMMGRISAWYFKEMALHPTSDYLKKLEKPVLILQGEKDVQVSLTEDFALYKNICTDKEHVQFKTYAGLNHLFMKAVYGTLKKVRKEYRIPQKVDERVIQDIAKWIVSR